MTYLDYKNNVKTLMACLVGRTLNSINKERDIYIIFYTNKYAPKNSIKFEYKNKKNSAR